MNKINRVNRLMNIRKGMTIMNKYYPHIFEPITIGNKIFKNRIFLPPMTNHLLQDLSTSPGPGYIEHRIQIAKSGAACVTFGNTLVLGEKSNPRSLFNLYDESGWKNWIKFTQAMHYFGAKASMEFTHFGAETERTPGMKDEDAWAWGASDCTIHNTAGEMRIKAMNFEQMDALANCYADYAEILVHLGFDVMLIHGGHGTLFENFLTPTQNTRTDEFNGSLENRAKFPILVLDRIRDRVGNKILIELRVSGTHYNNDGWDIEECIKYLHLIQDKIDIAHISAATARDPHLRSLLEPNGYAEPIPNAWLAKKVKESGLKIPVATVGGFGDNPADMERILANNEADIINVGRAFLADPELLTKIQEGRSQDIRPCIRCLTCLDDFKNTHYLSCSVNPNFGRADLLHLLEKPIKKNKNVAVVGAGAAGMEAAIKAYDRGHTVTVYEKNSLPGGMLNVADAMPFKYYLRDYKNYLIRQFYQRNISLHFNLTATPEMLKKENYDAIIVAVGSVSSIPHIEGADGTNVLTSIESLQHQEKVGNKVVIIGGGQIGCELALNFVMRGKQVSVIEMTSDFAKDEQRTLREEMLYEMDKYQVSLYPRTVCTKITQNRVYYQTEKMNEQFIDCDTVIFATGMRPNNDLAATFMDCASEVKIIGDCDSVSNIRKAITDGYDAGSSL